ncbi:hypothetical protein [Niastella sp. OAS944]|uniref:hypothetical protein n=1 Tax=Niastella sp. OAS944 TaxID=2664089 RepID=UPI003471A9C3|nr:hypothetical protein [Chitinophagaceae bacterium OAS944]
MANRIKKTFKLNVLGLFKWESENWTVKEVAFILAMIMAFILLVIGLLKLLQSQI